jgi:hypothetical protein
MRRTLWAVLSVVAVALAVPAMALAGHHRDLRHHRQHHGATGWNGPAGAAATVATYANGVLTLNLSSGGTLTANVGRETHFLCLGQRSPNGHRFAHKRAARRGHAADAGSTGSSGSTGITGSSGSTGTTGATGSTGSSGSRPGYPGGHDHGRGFGHGDPGYGNSHSYTPPPPCDSSLLVPGAPLQSAGVLVVPGGVQFGTIVLLPAVQ